MQSQATATFTECLGSVHVLFQMLSNLLNRKHLEDMSTEYHQNSHRHNVPISVVRLPPSGDSSIDSENLDKIDSHPLSLSIEPEEEADVAEELSTSLFRSLCPVTSQPDWATIYIRYKGNKINHKSLLKYLLSYRNHQGFHEECVERIFSDILQRIRIDDLFVRANFLRRGGIEINPVRVTPGNSPEIIREIRQ